MQPVKNPPLCYSTTIQMLKVFRVKFFVKLLVFVCSVVLVIVEIYHVVFHYRVQNV
jgi:hypothetical protein